jgi:chromate reductase, NAD(P)H dehydrogenase (quinone)
MGVSINLFGTARSQYHLRQALVILKMYPVNHPEVMIARADTRFDENGNLIDPDTEQLIRKLLEKLAKWTGKLEDAK